MILNPASGRGRGAGMTEAVRAEFGKWRVTDVRLTAHAGEESAIAREAVRGGATTIVAVGGDGTWSNVANGILESGSAARIAFLAAGTGNDFAKSLSLPASSIAATAALAIGSATRTIDAGTVNGRYFINSCGFGFDAAVLDHASRINWLRGNAVYLVASLAQLFTYRGVDISIGLDRSPPSRRRVMMLVAANAGHLGGAFLIAPDAKVDDGLLDVITVTDSGATGRLRMFAAATRGRHVGLPGVTVSRATSLRLSFDSPPVCQRDGERDQLESRDVDIGLSPGGLRVAVAG